MIRRAFLLIAICATLAIARDKPANWLQVQSPHFLVVTDGNEKQARHVADQFERMRLVFKSAFPNLQEDGGPPIVVIATKDEKDFRALEPKEYLAKGMLHLGGLFMRTADKNYVLMRLDAQGDHPYAVIYHEYTHLLIHKSGEQLPLWLDEGLAEYFENTDIQNNQASLGEPSLENLQLLRQNHLLPLSVLFTVDHNSPYYHEENKGSIFYAQSWALTHLLEFNDIHNHAHSLMDYVALVNQQVDPATAASRTFGDLSKLQKVLESYVGQSSFHYLKVPSSNEVDESTFQLKALAAPQANAVLADFLANNNRVPDARALLDTILHEDPNNVQAHETMGFIAFREGKLDEASKWYEDAVRLDSQSYLANYYFASITMRGEMDPEKEKLVESSLRTAIKLNPGFAPPYDRLATFYGMRRANLQEAQSLSVKAVKLDPTNIGYRINLASILMAGERGKDAVALLQKTLTLATSTAETDRVQIALEQAQRYQEYQESRIEMEAREKMQEANAASTSSQEADSPTPQHEETAPTGPHHFALGTIKNVHCAPSSSMDFDLTVASRILNMHSGNYYTLKFSALNFTPQSEFEPCTQLEGMHARVEYIEPAGKSTKAWVVAVEMRK